jgi:thiol:disulfide interchange protein
MDNQKNNQNIEPSSQGPNRPVCACQSKVGMWFMLIALVVVGAAILWSRFSSSESDTAGSASGVSIQWNTDYQAGMKLATEQNKPVLLAFTTSWCPPCKQMKKDVYTDAAVVKAAEAFVPIMVDPEVQTALANQYDIEGYPTYFFLKPDGTILEGFAGSVSAKEFAVKLNNARKMAS